MFDFSDIKKYEKWRGAWENKESMTLLEYISFNIDPEDVLIIGSLFLPKFIEIDECILLADNYEEGVYRELCLKFDNQSIEKEINCIHIYDVFANCTSNVEDAVFERVGKLLQGSWLNYLSAEFPSKQITVDYITNEKTYGPVLRIYQQ